MLVMLISFLRTKSIKHSITISREAGQPFYKCCSALYMPEFVAGICTFYW